MSLEERLSAGEVGSNVDMLASLKADQSVLDGVPTWHGRKIYMSGLLSWLYYLFFIGPWGTEKRLETIDHVMRRTLQTLRAYSVSELSTSERHEFLRKVYPLAKRVSKDPALNARVTREVRRFLPEETEETMQKLFEDLVVQGKQLKKEAVVEEFRLQTGVEFPLEELKALYQKEKPTSQQERVLKAWIEELNKIGSADSYVLQKITSFTNDVSSMLFLRAMRMLIKDFGECFLPKVSGVDFLVMRLTRRGLKLFDRPDPAFIKRRAEWIQNREVVTRFGGVVERIPLGESLNREGEDFSKARTLVFEHGRDPRLVVRISDNPRRQQLEVLEWTERCVESRYASSEVEGAPVAQFHLYQEEGERRCIRQGDGVYVVEAFDWQPKTDPLDDDSKRQQFMDHITQLYQDMLKYRYTPRNFSIDDLGYLGDQLKTSKNWGVDPIDLLQMVDALRRSGISFQIFDNIIINLELDHTEEAIFFDWILGYAYSEKEHDRFPKPRDVFDDHCDALPDRGKTFARSQKWIFTQAQLLQEKIREWRGRIKDNIQSRFDLTEAEENTLLRDIAQAIHDAYKGIEEVNGRDQYTGYIGFGRLYPEMEDRARRLLFKRKQYKMKPKLLEDIRPTMLRHIAMDSSQADLYLDRLGLTNPEQRRAMNVHIKRITDGR